MMPPSRPSTSTPFTLPSPPLHHFFPITPNSLIRPPLHSQPPNPFLGLLFMLPLSSFITSTSSSLVSRHRGPPAHRLPPPPPPQPPPLQPPSPLRRRLLPPRRHSYSLAALPHPPSSCYIPCLRRQSHPLAQSITTNNSPLAVLRSTSFRQQELDQARQAMEARLDTPSLCPLIAVTLRETVLRSILKDREKARTCMSGLLLDKGKAVTARLEQLHMAQYSQQELLQGCADALAFAPLVSQLESYARDRNLPGDCTSYCLDLGNASWVRIKTMQTFALPGSSPLFQHFDGCTLEVIRTHALSDLKLDTTGSVFYQLFQPVVANLVGVSLVGPGKKELEVVLEVGSSEGGLYVDAGGRGGGRGKGGVGGEGEGEAFRLACYGYETFFPQHAYPDCKALVKTWACTLPLPYQRTAHRHLVGLLIPVRHPLPVTERSGALKVMVSITN